MASIYFRINSKIKLHHYVCQFIFLVFLLGLKSTIEGQNQNYKVQTIAFYNLENLFDTDDDPKKRDELSPIMEIKSNREDIYQKKILNMARVINDIGRDLTNTAPAIVGVAEIENKKVLDDLISSMVLRKHDYGVVHYSSPDSRGIDVALIYKKSAFVPYHSTSNELKIFDDKTKRRVYTRNQLVVSGVMEGDSLTLMVNHWPSRRGGEARSSPKREAAAKLSMSLIDSIRFLNPKQKILVMGDFNDNPLNKSIKKILNTTRKKHKTKPNGLYNPMENMFKNGLGSNAYRDSWSLFDQIIVSGSLLQKDYSSYQYYKAAIFNNTYLTQQSGRYSGYPKRSFVGSSFTNGFSDHFPVYIYLIKNVKKE